MKKKAKSRIYDIIFILILFCALFLRITGVDWDAVAHPHPDERFLSMVTSALSPVEKITDYFDTHNSSLNPNNRGYDFFVYGTLPIFLTRYIGEWAGMTDYGSIFTIGRYLSAMADVIVVFLVYLIARRLYGEKVGLFAGVFSAFTVLGIQLSHFYVVDTFTNLFVVLTIYIAILIATQKPKIEYDQDGNQEKSYHLNWWLTIFFGISFGLSMASKLSAFPVALLLPLAVFIYIWEMPKDKKIENFWQLMACFSIGAIVSLVVFRIAQPYAFNGPSFFNFSINEKWWNAISYQQSQASGNIDWPPSIQWARRNKLFSFANLSLWGIGLPMAIVAWGGIIWTGIKLFKTKLAHEKTRTHLLLWVWTVFYFLWQSTSFNPTMRYQLQIYAPLAVFSGWCVVKLLDLPLKNQAIWKKILYITGKVVASFAIIGSIIWGLAFANIYTEDEPRYLASLWIVQNVPGAITLPIQTSQTETYNQQIGIPQGYIFQNDNPYSFTIVAHESGEIQEINLYNLQTIELLEDNNQNLNRIHVISIQIGDNQPAILIPELEEGKRGYTLQLSTPITLEKNMIYPVEIVVNSTDALSISGAAPINETAWDMGLPFRVSNYDPFGNLYRNDLNLDIYANGSEEKRERFISMLNDGDYIFISSSRQWGSLPRIPERYPLSIVYYQELMGCPEDISIESCYNQSQVGMFESNLGYNLVQVIENPPQLGNFIINDQSSEEAFTVYDHPKVFIFEKSPEFDPQHVADIFNAVDLSSFEHLTPKQASATGLTPEQAQNRPNLMLSTEDIIRQKESGTWSDLFNSHSLLNRIEFLGVIVWLFTIWLLGITIYPIQRFIFAGLPDKGYPLARITGMVLLAFLVWTGSNLGISFSRKEILIIWIALIAISSFATIKQWEPLKNEFKQYWKYYLFVEIIFLTVFVFGLLIRLGNPDLWHVSKGGEKPMDFAYFNAVLKSDSFPAYDPWFAGGYLNYYYFGFVLVGTPVKLLGLVPSFAYNLIMPTIAAIIALGGFSASWNLFLLNNRRREGAKYVSPWLVGGIGAIFLSIIGNMGIFQMLMSGFSKLGAQRANISFELGNFFQKAWWTIQGFFLALFGERISYYLSDYYWWPGRVIRAAGETEPITEFPFFTFIYADPHAHFFSFAVATLALGCTLALVFNFRKDSKNLFRHFTLVIVTALSVAVLYMTNTWDYPVYLALSVVAISIGIYSFYKSKIADKIIPWQNHLEKAILAIGSLGILAIAFKLFTASYNRWNIAGYSTIKQWTGQTTSVADYLTHWLLFLVIINAWLLWETRQVFANTPAKIWNTLKENLWAVIGIPVFVLLAILALWTVGNVKIAWLVVPLGTWIILLLSVKQFSIAKKIILFLAGSGFFLTLIVEVIVLEGDIARMNTVFKFYLQAWMFFAIAASVAMGWILEEIALWKKSWQKIFNTTIFILLFLAMLFPLVGTSAKIRDRMATEAPHTLDGMDYMAYASYYDQDRLISFDEDYDLIHWMQENISGTPTIIEAQIGEYRWGSRISIYTGLPTVLGWNWHQRQQRGVLQDAEVWERSFEITTFYETLEHSFVKEFLETYGIEYIIVGQLEHAYYDSVGLEKFSDWDGLDWQKVYENGETALYQVVK